MEDTRLEAGWSSKDLNDNLGRKLYQEQGIQMPQQNIERPRDEISGLALTSHYRYSGLKQCKSNLS